MSNDNVVDLGSRRESKEAEEILEEREKALLERIKLSIKELNSLYLLVKMGPSGDCLFFLDMAFDTLTDRIYKLQSETIEDLQECLGDDENKDLPNRATVEAILRDAAVKNKEDRLKHQIESCMDDDGKICED